MIKQFWARLLVRLHLRKAEITTGWELHPCTVPVYRSMWKPVGRDGKLHLVARPDPAAFVGNIWHCWCGRRWRCTGVAVPESGNTDLAELRFELVNELDEEDFVELERIANGDE